MSESLNIQFNPTALNGEEGDLAFNPMVIMVHLLQRYLTEISRKPKYAVDLFFQSTRKKINQSLDKKSASNVKATFFKFTEILQKEHHGLMTGILQSPQMRENERKLIARMLKYSGKEEEQLDMLRMLKAIKKDQIFRRQIDKLVKLVDLNQPTPAVIPEGFIAYLNSLTGNSPKFIAMVTHIFGKASTSQRMAKLMAAIFLALNDPSRVNTLKKVFPLLLKVPKNRYAFANTFANIFLVKDYQLTDKDHYTRVSRQLRESLKPGVFIKQFNGLPPNKLLPSNHALTLILNSAIKRFPGFLVDLTQRMFIYSPPESLPKIPLDMIRRGLVQVYRYDPEQADEYLKKFADSIPFYYQKYLPEEQKTNSHFFLMISALNRYASELLDSIRKESIFRGSEVDVLMPIINAIREFSSVKDQSQAVEKIWEMLRLVRQRKEIRDELTLIKKLTDSNSATYLKEFVPYVNGLIDDTERFQLVFEYILEQTKLDPVKYGPAVDWHINLLSNIIRYLSDTAITSDHECRPILSVLVSYWVDIYQNSLLDILNDLSRDYLNAIRSLLAYLYRYYPDTLTKLVEMLLSARDEAYYYQANAYIQFIHTTLLELARQTGMEPQDTAREISNIEQIFEDCCEKLGEGMTDRKEEIFSDAYMSRIGHLLRVEKKAAPVVPQNESLKELPSFVATLLNQSSKLFNIPNFSLRVSNNLIEIQNWIIKEIDQSVPKIAPLLEKISTIYKLFSSQFNFPQVSSNSIFHNYAYKNEFDYFSFCLLVYLICRKQKWDEFMVRNAWRDVTITTVVGAEDLDLKQNGIVNSKAMIGTKGRFFKELERLFTPLKAEVALETFFHLKNGIALAETRKYRTASISLDKAIQLNRTNIYAHYWRAIALKKARINLEQYENHITIVEKYYPNCNEIEMLKSTPY